MRTDAVDVQTDRHAAAVQLHRGRDGEVRALLPREPAGVHQSQHLDGPARAGAEGRQVDAERDAYDRAARGGSDLGELLPGVLGGDHDGVDAADEEPVEQADRDLGRGVEPGAQREHVVEPLVREQHRPDALTPRPAGDGEEGELVAELDRRRPPLLEDVGHPPRLDDQPVAAAHPRRAELDDLSERRRGASVHGTGHHEQPLAAGADVPRTQRVQRRTHPS
ncbi:hypothetical protein GCM10011376_11080 [Nocardioides flavus (ex Wang et al. 2016)]|uniref:Uncharacterized protein n=1 Tax=Nocardioides flavus (ex Wang et al. 2016) TaxID=2058780 RepID=A0ABQ3HFW0_9ACTN|nr:hypothetical protein GCM10011376_11080 [Nocardioides flavus (ex Wang et al. 2016)]